MYNKNIFLPLLVFIFLLSGCVQKSPHEGHVENFAVLKQYVKQIDDKPRAKNIYWLVLAMEGNVTTLQKEFDSFLVEARKKLSDYDTQREELDTFYDAWIVKRTQLENNLIDINFDVKALTSDEEFKKITELTQIGYEHLDVSMRVN